jgi:hypothetical protein
MEMNKAERYFAYIDNKNSFSEKAKKMADEIAYDVVAHHINFEKYIPHENGMFTFYLVAQKIELEDLNLLKAKLNPCKIEFNTNRSEVSLIVYLKGNEKEKIEE